MILTKSRTKTQIELFNEVMRAREIQLGVRIKHKTKFDNQGNITSVETDNPDLITWLQSRGFS
ncbi:MAG TPA: hypothetical protein VIH04_07960 [Nitrosarchaeum sp.]